MVVMFKMTSDKREKYIRKLEKMSDFIDEFKECLENSDDYEDGEDWEEENPQFKTAMRRAMRAAGKSRYSKRGEMY